MQMAKILYKNLPETPGVYLMKGTRGKVLYIGKAGNLRRRVSSYFMKVHDAKTEKLLAEIKKIDYFKTDTAIEALILESQLIKKYEPPYNAKEKDDKSFLHVLITKEDFPRVLLVRGRALPAVALAKVGPFTSAVSIREALRIIRRIFPYSIHPSTWLGASPSGRSKRLYPQRSRRACLDYELGLCPGTCIGAVSRTEYLKNIGNIKLFLKGKKKLLITNLEKEMKTASKKLEFEKAEKLRRQIFAIKHIRDVALIADESIENWKLKIGNSAKRIEGYDISNTSGTSAVGSMVVFTNGKPDKDEYRKFKISTITASDDVGMIKEMLRRRFNNPWPYPVLILIDGGKAQVNVTKSVLNEFGLALPVTGVAKGPGRRKNEFVGYKPSEEEKKLLIKIRDEAHRFALGYHRKLRSARFIGV
ncbi:MAG: UvrB/UvrC motif-containing protein [Candidatus Colwellbacteria bacterium]|nr:UvrB/UvrC motif-containing protein [Candidatus Colwellbacteria bacterium]